MLILFVWFIAAGVIYVWFSGIVPMSTGMGLFVFQLLGFGMPCGVVLIRKRGKIREILPMQRLDVKNILMLTGMALAFVPMLMFIATVSQMFFTDIISEVVEEVNMEVSLLWALFFIGVVPSVFEELAFRGVIFSGYKDVPIIKAALVNALFFGIIHMNMQQFFFTAVAGFVWCFFVFYTRSIWAAVFAHFINNGTQVLFSFWVLGMDDYTIDGYAAYEGDLVAALIALGVIVAIGMVIFFVIYRRFKAHNIRRNAAFDELMAEDAEPIVDEPDIFDEAPPTAKPRIITASLCVVVALFAVFMLLIEFTPDEPAPSYQQDSYISARNSKATSSAYHSYT